MTKPADLSAYVFDGRRHALAGELRRWMEASPRFTAFVETYQDKIRKKIRVTREPESIQDLRAELETACRLLADRRLEVAYEPYASARKRGPDFAVTYRARLVFNVEVARLRNGAGEADDLARIEEKVVRILLAKLGQMQPGQPNLLAVHTRAGAAQGAQASPALDLERLMQAVKVLVEKKDPAFYAYTRYTGPADFYRDFLRLTGLLLWSPAPQLWVNKQARPTLPDKVLNLVVEAAEEDES